MGYTCSHTLEARIIAGRRATMTHDECERHFNTIHEALDNWDSLSPATQDFIRAGMLRMRAKVEAEKERRSELARSILSD